MLDKEVHKFVQTAVESFIDWDILNFFSMNPRAKFSIDDLTVVLGRSKAELSKSMTKLAEKSLLDCSDNDIYCLTSDSEKQRMIENFRKASVNREKRLRMLSILLRKRKGFNWK